MDVLHCRQPANDYPFMFHEKPTLTCLPLGLLLFFCCDHLGVLLKMPASLERLLVREPGQPALYWRLFVIEIGQPASCGIIFVNAFGQPASYVTLFVHSLGQPASCFLLFVWSCDQPTSCGIEFVSSLGQPASCMTPRREAEESTTSLREVAAGRMFWIG